MAIPVQTQLYDAFLGTQEGIHSIILPDIFSSGGSKNLWIDKFGRTKKIQGYSKQNGSAILTDTGGSATLIRALIPYRSTAGGSITRQLLTVVDDNTNEWELYYSTNSGVTNTFIFDAGAASVGAIPDFAQFGDNGYVVNGVIAPRRWNGSALATAGRAQSPTPTAAASANAGNLSGAYKWKLIAIYAADGTRKAGSVASSVLSRQDNQATLSWTADADTNVGGYEIYRTTGSGEVFYLVDYVDGRTTVSYTDNVSDITILENRVMEEHGDPPPVGSYYAEPHQQRMWWARTSSFPTRAYWSDAGLAEDVYANNFLDFSDSETIGDTITGMLGNFKGRLVVGTERAIWTVSGTGNVIGNIVDWNPRHSDAQTGWVTHRSVVKIPAGAKYVDTQGKTQTTTEVSLGYMSSLGDIRLFDGDSDTIISYPMKTTLAAFKYADRAKTFVVTDTDRGEATWVFSGGTTGEPNTAIVWNYRWGVWYARDWSFGHAVETEKSDDASLLLAGSNSTVTGGYIYLLWNTNAFDGANINAIWMTKTLYGKRTLFQGEITALSQLKRWRWVDILLQGDVTTELTVEWMPGHSLDSQAATGSTIVMSASGFLRDANGNLLAASGGEHLIISQETSELRAKLKTSQGDYLHHEGVRLRISDNTSNGPWAIEALNLAYQVIPGLQRRMQ